MNNCYVYVYLDPERLGKFYYAGLDMCFLYEPFYIGKGTNNRLTKHLTESSLSDSSNLLKNKRLKKIVYEFKKPHILKIAEGLSDKEAFLYEKYIVELIGKIIENRGPLTNVVDGGNGFNSGSIPWNKNKKMSEEYRSNLSLKLSSPKNRKINSLSKLGSNNPMYKHVEKNVIELFIKLYNEGSSMVHVMKCINISRKIYERLRRENKHQLLTKKEIKKKEIERVIKSFKEYKNKKGYLYGVIEYISKKEKKCRKYIRSILKEKVD